MFITVYDISNVLLTLDSGLWVVKTHCLTTTTYWTVNIRIMYFFVRKSGVSILCNSIDSIHYDEL